MDQWSFYTMFKKKKKIWSFYDNNCFQKNKNKRIHIVDALMCVTFYFV